MEKIKLSNFGFRILQIETKAACNMACSFCPYPLKEDKTSSLEMNEIKKIINQINSGDKEFKYRKKRNDNRMFMEHNLFRHKIRYV